MFIMKIMALYAKRPGAIGLLMHLKSNGQKMNTPFEKMLSERPWILADGATGTNLFNMGLLSGDAPELWNEQHPHQIWTENHFLLYSDYFRHYPLRLHTHLPIKLYLQ